MGVMRMGYAHVRVTDLAEAKHHYANTMGLYETLAEGNKVYYKGWDEWDHHSVVLEEGGVGLVKFGFKVERAEDIAELFAAPFFFGCEADDPMVRMAFDTAANPFGSKLKAVFGGRGKVNMFEMTKLVSKHLS